MRFYTHQHPFYCGLDLHARSMYVCVLSHDGDIGLHRNRKAAPQPFLKAWLPIVRAWGWPLNASAPDTASLTSALKKAAPAFWDMPSI